MKTAGLYLFLLLTFIPAFAQETEMIRPISLHQLYLGFGAGLTKPFSSDLKNNSLTLFSHLNISFSESSFFRGGLYYAEYKDNLGRFQNLGYTGDEHPYHQLYSNYLSVGKRKQINNFLIIQAAAGISYNQHFSPENVRYRSSYGPSLFGGYPFDYEVKKLHKPGIIVQAEILGVKNSDGISLGTFFHYIPQASHAGLTLAFNLGLIARPLFTF